ncbi:MAG TPA: caspase family protein [Gemmataceae bacterium]|nr:caspase family protein [Gemmataceae bacterium]
MNTFIRTSKNLLIATAVVALMTAATAQARAEGNNVDLHYVAVGVSKIPMMPPQHQLRYAHKDAQDLARVWEAQKGKIYTNVHGETLTDETAKLSDIMAALDRLISNAKKGDTAVVSFAGHGGVLPGRNPQWVFETSNFDPKDVQGTLLFESALREKLAKLAAGGVNVILVLDTCHAGAFGSGDSGIVVLAACAATQSSGEHELVGNGFYTSALIEALSGKADLNGDGIITLEEVETYVAKRVAEYDAMYPAFDHNGQKMVQIPTSFRPASMQNGLALAGGSNNNTLPPGINMDRVRN